MADDSLLIGDLAINPDLTNDYLMASYNDQWQAFQAGWGGAVVTLPASDEILPGTRVYKPKLAMVAALGKLDVTNETAKDSTKGPLGVLPYGPVCSNAPDNPIEFFSHAIRAYKKNDQAIEATLGQMLAQRVVNARKLDVLYALRGAIGATSTVSHVEDESSASTKTLQLTDIMDAKAILGDAQSALRVMIIHSKAWLSAKKDIVTGSNYNIERVGDMTVLGGVPGLEGMVIILCDDGTKVAGASAGADAYYTFLLGAGVVNITPAINSPLFTAEVGVGKGARSTKVTVEDHYGLNLDGMAMTTDATGNPTTAELYDTTNWGEAFSHDHRDFRAVYIKTLNG